MSCDTLALPPPQAAHAHSSAEFQGFCPLAAGHIEGFIQTGFQPQPDFPQTGPAATPQLV